MSVTTELPIEAPGPGGAATGKLPWWRRRRVLIAVAAGVVVAVVATWLVAFSSVLGVRTIQVLGTHVLRPAEVVRAADVARGTPLVRIDTAAIAQRVEKLGEVADAHVSTSMPSTLIIDVTERTPVGWVRVAGRAVLVDRTGNRYRDVPHRPQLPRLILPSGAGSATTAAVAHVAAALPADLLPRVRSIQALDPNAITLVIKGDRIVHWGSAARSADKARVLPVLLRRGDSTIDVSDPDQPFTR